MVDRRTRNGRENRRLEDFDANVILQLTPFVARRVEARKDSFAHTETKSPMDGKEYLRKWKEEGGNI